MCRTGVPEADDAVAVSSDDCVGPRGQNGLSDCIRHVHDSTSGSDFHLHEQEPGILWRKYYIRQLFWKRASCCSTIVSIFLHKTRGYTGPGADARMVGKSN